jgi:hypothetical protein
MSLRSLPEKISAFLTQRPGRAYCDTCIQERLGLKWRQQVQLVTATLAVTDRYARKLDRCCNCGSERQVTITVPEPAHRAASAQTPGRVRKAAQRSAAA